MAVPFSVGDILSYGEWEVLTFIAATMGPAEVAAWCLAGGFLCDVIFLNKHFF